MSRQPRLTVPGYPHHIIQRGNNRQPIFVDDADRHGAAADAICPPAEWDQRLWSRGQHTDLHPPPGA